MKSDNFNLKRFLRLLRADLALNAGWILPAAAVFFWVMTVGSLFKGFLSGNPPIAPFFYFFMLFLGGLIMTSLSFAELADRRKTHGFLLLPCSAFEKYLSRYILTSWLYVAGSLIAYSAFIFLAGTVYSLFHAHTFSYSACFKHQNVRYLFYYLLVHPVFLMGAVYFKKQAFLKTAVAVLALPFILFSFHTLLIRIFYHDTIFLPNYSSQTGFFPFIYSRWEFPNFDLMDIFWLLTLWPFPALPPFLLIIGYLRLKEREAVDGV
jgi:hypothetical protein